MYNNYKEFCAEFLAESKA